LSQPVRILIARPSTRIPQKVRLFSYLSTEGPVAHKTAGFALTPTPDMQDICE
jgi:hypothetical protein